ncbi:MAG: helix-hairpin-helix domain-containing protein [Paraglaciecola sp.]|uniref:ComEA family DNA-binding protein n=1 Tax=Paraglaciecola sp. TaxID=1920173 RepID=UPI00273F6703|nr:helix-hairpin-helix domain-containing protein [Paraglaciecola sp.]MDP5031445.1 helix-hairpin-helix domain-containing protein [Paraglaciecola sp.]MDP5040738.1 helix-hairpin-helix domain-containing protein [Paraglaciecola sp.]MDP5130790.1 helix-hairpin-helix domain-containing protein [Paraglaciecola sp.]
MKKIIPLLLLSSTFLFSISPLVLADSVVDKTKAMQMKMQKINVNTASLDELTALPGVGKKKAAAIIEYREKMGKFTSLDQLADVKGIGKKMLEKMKDHVSL